MDVPKVLGKQYIHNSFMHSLIPEFLYSLILTFLHSSLYPTTYLTLGTIIPKLGENHCFTT
jgi:hypothetical protein